MSTHNHLCRLWAQEWNCSRVWNVLLHSFKSGRQESPEWGRLETSATGKGGMLLMGNAIAQPVLARPGACSVCCPLPRRLVRTASPSLGSPLFLVDTFSTSLPAGGKLDPPRELLNFLMLRPHPRPIKGEALSVETSVRSFAS